MSPERYERVRQLWEEALDAQIIDAERQLTTARRVAAERLEERLATLRQLKAFYGQPSPSLARH